MFFAARQAYALSAQPETDSLLIAGDTLFQSSHRVNYAMGKYLGLLLKSRHYRFSDKDSSFYYLKMGDSLVTEKDTEVKLLALTNLTRLHYRFGQYDSSSMYAERGLALSSKHKDQIYMADFHWLTGRNLRAIADFPKSLYHYRQALLILENQNSPIRVIQVLRGMSLDYDDLKDYQQAYDLAVRSIELQKEREGGSFEITRTMLNNLGRFLTKLKRYDEALDYLYRAEKAYREQIPEDCELRFPHYNLGSAFFQTDQLDSATYYLTSAIEHAKACEDNYVLSLALHDLGQVFLSQGKQNQALPLFRQALSAAEARNEVTNELINANYALYEAYRIAGNVTSALKYHEQWSMVKDSLFNEERSTELALQEADYRFEREKNQLIANQERERLTLENQLRRRETIQWASITVIGTILGFMIYVISLLQKKKRANRLISEQNLQISESARELEKLSDFKEGLTSMIAHDMKNSLNTILSVSHESKTLDNKRVSRIRKAGDDVLNLVTTMLDVQKFEEAKFQLRKERSYTSLLFKHAQQKVVPVLQSKSVQLIIQANETIPVEVDQDVMLRVLVNLLTNAIKFSENGRQISMNAHVNQDSQPPEMVISVADQGTGIAAADLPYIFDKFRQSEDRSSGNVPSTGLGLTFCRLAVQAHEGRIWASSELGEGTTISFSVPILEDVSQADLSEHKPVLHKKEASVDLNEGEQEILRKYAGQMKGVKVHQIKKLRVLLNELEQECPETKWSEEIWGAILQGNNERYQYLLEKVL